MIYNNGGQRMPKISTHLHLALKLSQKIKISDLNSFYLGNAFPDCWNESDDNAKKYHYFKELSYECDLESFIKNEDINNFNFGHYFHLWVDNHISQVLLEYNYTNINKYDCIICDMPIIAFIIEELKQYTCIKKQYQALKNILSLESEPVPLYIVSIEKKKNYEEILDKLIDEFLNDDYIKEYEYYRSHRK